MGKQYEDSIYNDPIWEYTLATRLQPYLPAVRRWWAEYEKRVITGTGVFQVAYEDIPCPPGLYMRVTYAASRSPIKNLQAFPYVPTSFLQITGVAGGVNRMIERECCGNKFKIEEFTIVEKHNLPSTVQQGQFLAFVPTDILEGNNMLGRYVYFTMPELVQLANGTIPKSAKLKFDKYIS